MTTDRDQLVKRLRNKIARQIPWDSPQAREDKELVALAANTIEAAEQLVEDVERERDEARSLSLGVNGELMARVNMAEQRIKELEGALRRLQNGPDTLTQYGLSIVNVALFPAPEEGETCKRCGGSGEGRGFFTVDNDYVATDCDACNGTGEE